MFHSLTGMQRMIWHPPPLPDRVTPRFSEMKLSSSNFPTFTLSQGLWNKLSKRAFTDSKWKAPVSSEEGTSRNEMFFSRVPPVRMSSPPKLNPVVARPVWPLAVSADILLMLSRLQNGVMRKRIGQYPRCFQMG